MDMKSLLNVILAQNDILSNRSLPQKLEDPLCGNEVNPGWLEIRDRNNKKEVVLVKAKATAGPPQFHDSRKGGSQKVVSVHRVSGLAPKMTESTVMRCHQVGHGTNRDWVIS